MSDDVIIGYDGRARCAWAGGGDTAFSHYHDEVWGTRTYDESAMFEALTLGVFEAGLSWSIVFGKRDAFRDVFHNFNVAKVAAMTGQDVDRLLQNSSIIRNRAKVKATVDNARTMMSASPSLPALAKSFETTRKGAPRARPPGCPWPWAASTTRSARARARCTSSPCTALCNRAVSAAC